ncbi:NAD(P)-dependent oxidoreductase [Saccharospirillum alexandrii]|uniref:NAD(P)-dependent oxidoreductase n=1 Tax=Saccharospirillum alexandrii TaxID=2448477 RepID=UPI0017068EA1
MNVSLIGLGDMGHDIARHVVAGGFTVTGFDVDPERRNAAAALGVDVQNTLAGAVAHAKVHIVMVATDEQSEQVTREILEEGVAGSVIVITATNGPKTMQTLAKACRERGFGFVDAPVCFGRVGAREGTLASLCGGSDADIETIRPVLDCYSRAVHHIGPVGAGQIGKACNNMMHWAHCVANYEVLLLAKRYGINAQRMREVLLECPAENGTLRRWDSTRFTWHEKDMDLALDMAQAGDIPMPLFGQVDQLVKRLDKEMVKELLHGPEADYLGWHLTALPPEKGGLN